MSLPAHIALRLATAMLRGAFETSALFESAAGLWGRRSEWLLRLAERISAAFGSRSRPRTGELAEFIGRDAGFRRVVNRLARRGVLQEKTARIRSNRPQVMSPSFGRPATWRVPALVTPEELAAWLGLTLGELDWLADWQGRERRTQNARLRHYWYRWIPKRSGGLRLMESPKPRLKAIQRRLLREILDEIPPHPAAHGFRRGRSTKSFVEPHVARQVVLKMDLRDFFLSIKRPVVEGIFGAAGYPDRVALLLAGLCTNSAPSEIWDDPLFQAQGRREDRSEQVRWPHLPQGAPTSPALANLCAYRLDLRLQALAARVPATYTRYADDLLFSGGVELAKSAKRLEIQIAAIAMEEGFQVHHRKTRLMRQSVRQHAAGIVINEKLNVRRRDYDQLKAILRNCLREGPMSQNRSEVSDFRAHLLGRIQQIRSLHPIRGDRLREMFDRITW